MVDPAPSAEKTLQSLGPNEFIGFNYRFKGFTWV